MTKDEIDNYFKVRELRYIKTAENAWWLRFRNRIANYERYFEFFVTLLDDWLYVRVPLLVADNEACWPSLTEYLLGLNRTLFLTKVAIQGRQVQFMVELPVRCTSVDLQEALIAIDTYVRTYFLDIEMMATNSRLAMLVHTILQDSAGSGNVEQFEDVPEIIFND